MPNIPVVWRAQQTVNTVTAGDQSDPDIVQLARGNILVSWTTTGTGDGPADGVGSSVLAQLYDPLGEKIGEEFRLNNNSESHDEWDSDLAALPSGSFIAVYKDDAAGAGADAIRVEEFTEDGLELGENSIVVQDADGSADPNYVNQRIAAASDTSAMIVYLIDDGSPTIAGKIYNPTTDSYGAQIDLLSSINYTALDVAALNNGNYVVAATGNFGAQAWYRIVTPQGTNVLGDTAIPGSSGGVSGNIKPSVTPLSGGGFVINWTTTGIGVPIPNNVGFRVYNAAGVETGAGWVGVNDTYDEGVVTGLADGTFVIAYRNISAARLEIQRFTAAGVSLGTFDAGPYGQRAAVTDLADGRFAVAWRASSGEIAMQIFDTRDAPNNAGAYPPSKQVVGTIGNDVFTPAADVVIVHAWTGNDVITESAGVKQYFGDAGNDTIRVTSVINGGESGAGDRHDGGADVDTIDWSLSNNPGAQYDLGSTGVGIAYSADGNFFEYMQNFENLTGSNNVESILGSDGANVISALGGNDVVSGLGGVDVLNGGTGDDLLRGDAGNDTLNGGDGLDQLYGDAGEDTINGDVGNDTAVGGAGKDTINGGVGNDFLFGVDFAPDGSFAVSSGDDTLNGGDGNDGLWGGDGLDTMNGGAGNDTLVGGAGNDVMSGGDSIDFLFGGDFSTTNGSRLPGSGADTLNGGNGNDALYGFDGNDIINGDAGSDYVEAGEDNDVVNGGADNDTLLGQAGNDTITGGSGFDYLYGGAGADLFSFRESDSYDSVWDFSAALGDRLRVDPAFGFTSAAQVMAAFTGFTFEGVAYTVLDRPASIDRLTIKGVAPSAWVPSMIEIA